MLKITAIAALAGVATSATAQFDTTGLELSDYSYTVEATRIGDNPNADRSVSVFDNIAGPYASFPDTTGDPLNGANGTAIYADAYISTAADHFMLESLQFVGGPFDLGVAGVDDGLGLVFFDEGWRAVSPKVLSPRVGGWERKKEAAPAGLPLPTSTIF